MEKTVHILVIGPDPSLPGEFEAALAGIKSHRVVLHTVDEYRRGVEEARTRQPDLACVEMMRDPAQLQALSDELAMAAPQSVMIGVFNRETFDDDQDEGTYLIQALRSQVRDFLRRPVSSSELRGILDRYLVERPHTSGRDGRVVSFISNKGGVGKSTLSVSVACQLAKSHPERVLLIDTSLQLGICAAMLDISPRTTLVNIAHDLARLDDVLLREIALSHESGLQLLAAPADAMQAANVDEDTVSRVLAIARRSYDYVIVDTFPVLDAVALAVLDRSETSYVVVGNNVPTVIGAEGLLGVLDQVGFPQERQRVVLNCTHPRHATQLRPQEVERRLGRTVDHVVPYEKQLLSALNTGDPYILHTRGMLGFGKAVRRLAEEIESGEQAADAAPARLERADDGDDEISLRTETA